MVQNQSSQTSQTSPSSPGTSKVLSIISYISILWLISYIVNRNQGMNREVDFHVKQGMRLSILSIVAWIAMMVGGCPPLNAEALEVGLQAQQGFILCVPPHERKAVLMVHDLSIGTAFLFK